MKTILLPVGSDDMKDSIELEIPDSSCFARIIEERKFEKAKKVFEKQIISEAERAREKGGLQWVSKKCL